MVESSSLCYNKDMTITPGQPIDLATITQAINDLNDLTAVVKTSTSNSIYVGQDSVSVQNATSKMSMEAAYVNLDKTETKADSVQFRHTFKTNFTKPPVVTATLFEKSSSSVVQNHSVVITSITTREIVGYVKFEASGKFNSLINLIAIGYV